MQSYSGLHSAPLPAANEDMMPKTWTNGDKNCLLREISPFPSVLKTCIWQTRKNQGLFRKGANQVKNSLSWNDLDGWMDGMIWMDGWMDGWNDLDGWMGGWRDGWVDQDRWMDGG